MTTAQLNAPENGSWSKVQASVLNRLTSVDVTGATPDVQVRTASASDQSRLVATIVLAFGNDPAVRWAYPASENYLAAFPEFVLAFGGKAFEHGTAYFIGDVKAAALWLPPGVEPDEEALVGLFQRTVPEQDHGALFAMFEQMGHYHPVEPHWYLPLIGVDPTQQRKGLGSALLEPVLRVCDEDGIPAYLEASSLESVPLYRRHGFEILGTIQVGTSPPITPMLRLPR